MSDVARRYKNLTDLQVSMIQGFGMQINRNLKAAKQDEIPMDTIVRYFDEEYLVLDNEEGGVFRSYKTTPKFEDLRTILQFGR